MVSVREVAVEHIGLEILICVIVTNISDLHHQFLLIFRSVDILSLYEEPWGKYPADVLVVSEVQSVLWGGILIERVNIPDELLLRAPVLVAGVPDEGLGLADGSEVVQPWLTEVLVDVVWLLQTVDQIVNFLQAARVGVVHISTDYQANGERFVPEQFLLHLNKQFHAGVLVYQFCLIKIDHDIEDSVDRDSQVGQVDEHDGHPKCSRPQNPPDYLDYSVFSLLSFLPFLCLIVWVDLIFASLQAETGGVARSFLHRAEGQPTASLFLRPARDGEAGAEESEHVEEVHHQRGPRVQTENLQRKNSVRSALSLSGHWSTWT